MSSRPSLQLFESRTPSPAVSKTIPAKGRSCYPSGPAFARSGEVACAGHELAGRGVRGVECAWGGRASGCGGLAGRGTAILRADNARFGVIENTPYLWHFDPWTVVIFREWFIILFMNNHEYRTDVLKQLNGGYNVNNEHISTLKRYSNDLDTRDKRKERRTLHD